MSFGEAANDRIKLRWSWRLFAFGPACVPCLRSSSCLFLCFLIFLGFPNPNFKLKFKVKERISRGEERYSRCQHGWNSSPSPWPSSRAAAYLPDKYTFLPRANQLNPRRAAVIWRWWKFHVRLLVPNIFHIRCHVCEFNWKSISVENSSSEIDSPTKGCCKRMYFCSLTVLISRKYIWNFMETTAGLDMQYLHVWCRKIVYY